MTLTIKETDWITVNYDKPETLPKIGENVLLLYDGGLRFGPILKNNVHDILNVLVNGLDEEWVEGGAFYVSVDIDKLNWRRHPIPATDKRLENKLVFYRAWDLSFPMFGKMFGKMIFGESNLTNRLALFDWKNDPFYDDFSDLDRFAVVDIEGWPAAEE